MIAQFIGRLMPYMILAAGICIVWHPEQMTLDEIWAVRVGWVAIVVGIFSAWHDWNYDWGRK